MVTTASAGKVISLCCQYKLPVSTVYTATPCLQGRTAARTGTIDVYHLVPVTLMLTPCALSRYGAWNLTSAWCVCSSGTGRRKLTGTKVLKLLRAYA